MRPDAKLSIRDIKSTIGHDIAVTLPRCDAQMSRAQRVQRAAKPMMETQARSPYAKAVRAIWAAVLDGKTAQQEPQQTRPLLKRVFG